MICSSRVLKLFLTIYHFSFNQEVRTVEGWENRHRNKKLIKNAVFQEQDMQQAEQEYDDELFARVSEDASYAARQQARARGQQDEAESMRVNNIHKVPSHETERMEEDSAASATDFDYSYFSFL